MMTSLLTRPEWFTMTSIHPGHEHPAVHGMLVVGEGQVFLSHLPMFHAPHDYQIIMEVRLRGKDSNPHALYTRDRRNTGERLYTWVPKPFILPGLVSSPPSVSTMQGAVFRGHFERGGTPITADTVLAEVARILYSRQLILADDASSRLRYVLFGSPHEPFLAHLITRPPDSDHVLSVVLPQVPSRWDGSSLVLEISDRQNVLDQRLREGDEVDCKILSQPGPGLRVIVGQEIYFETGDLAS
jgi:hypothetical protein